jgi:rhodanese-related sulfurtransferase
MDLEISVEELARRRREDPADFVLLDCREAGELDLASLDGALHIPMGDIPSRLQQLDPERDLLVLCHHGQRSLSVTCYLRDQDYDRCWSVRGGIDLWSRRVDPELPRY